MKNFRVDLILETERRSASPVNPRVAGRMAAMLVITLLVVWGTVFATKVILVKQRAKERQVRWKAIEPQQKIVKAVTEQSRRNKGMHDEIQAWNRSRMEWHKHLAEFQQIVPKNICITRFNVDGSIGQSDDAKYAALRFEMTLEGSAEGRNPVDEVLKFERELKQGPGFKGRVVDETLVDLRKDPSAEERRLFKIMVKYRARLFANEAT